MGKNINTNWESYVLAWHPELGLFRRTPDISRLAIKWQEVSPAFSRAIRLFFWAKVASRPSPVCKIYRLPPRCIQEGRRPSRVARAGEGRSSTGEIRQVSFSTYQKQGCAACTPRANPPLGDLQCGRTTAAPRCWGSSMPMGDGPVFAPKPFLERLLCIPLLQTLAESSPLSHSLIFPLAGSDCL